MLARYVPGRRATVSMGKTGTSSYMSPTLSLLWSASWMVPPRLHYSDRARVVLLGLDCGMPKGKYLASIITL